MNDARRPRAVVKVNGTTTKPLSFSVENNTNFQADTFTFELECWQQADGFGLEYWASTGTTMIEVLIGFLQPGDDPDASPGSLQSLIIGEVDDANSDLNNGTITITGRDLTGRLIDTKTTVTSPDQTASQIVTKLAAQVGLTPQVTATTTPVGRYSKSAYAAVSREAPLWDIITTYAQQEGFDAYVTGTTLYFGPSQAESDPNPYPITVEYDDEANALNCSAETLHLKRSLTFAKDITVTVIGHSVKTGKPVKEVASRQGVKTTKSSQSKSQPAQNYVIRKPNITAQQALELAQKTLADLTIHERTFDATNVADGTLTTRRKARISGTNTSFDTDYFIDKVTHAFNFGQFGMTFSGKNHPTETQLSS